MRAENHVMTVKHDTSKLISLNKYLIQIRELSVKTLGVKNFEDSSRKLSRVTVIHGLLQAACYLSLLSFFLLSFLSFLINYLRNSNYINYLLVQ